MKKLYAINNLVKLYLLKSKLEDAGVCCSLKNENPPLAGEIPSIVAWPELWVVDDAKYDRALTILQTELSNKAALEVSWICPNCNEQLDKEFNVCWKCGHSRP